MKDLIWISATRKRVKDFPDEARRQAGEQLWRVQKGGEPEDWRSMPSIGAGAIEIRIHRPYEHRVVYVATHPEGIYVLHAFGKKTQHTPQKELDIARANYAKMEQQRTKAKPRTDTRKK